MKTIQRNGLTVYLNNQGKEIGFINRENQYVTERDNKRGHIFHNLKYKNAVAFDFDLIQNLIKKKVNLIKVRIINFEKDNFWILINPSQFFIKAHGWEHGIFNYDKRNQDGQNYTGYGTQLRLPLNDFIRIYDDIKDLRLYIK